MPQERDSFQWACIRRTSAGTRIIRHASSYTTSRRPERGVADRGLHPGGGTGHDEGDGGVVARESGGVDDLHRRVEVERVGRRAVEQAGEITDDEATSSRVASRDCVGQSPPRWAYRAWCAMSSVGRIRASTTSGSSGIGCRSTSASGRLTRSRAR